MRKLLPDRAPDLLGIMQGVYTEYVNMHMQVEAITNYKACATYIIKF